MITNSAFADTISAYGGNSPAQCSGTPVAVIQWGQEWRVGSASPGYSSERYLSGRAHGDVFSPAP